MNKFRDHLIQSKRSYYDFVDVVSRSLKNTHKKVEIGTDNGMPIFLWQSYEPEYLITAGWQGDEPAGWEACRELAARGFKTLSYLPVVCPSAFVYNEHLDWQGINPDRFFPDPMAESSRAVAAVTELLVSLSPKGHLSLQEDPRRSFAYAYSWGRSPISKVIQIFDDGPRKGLVIWKNGEREGKHEGMFCEHMHKNGVPYCIQTETPADGTVPLINRVTAQVDVVVALTQSQE